MQRLVKLHLESTLRNFLERRFLAVDLSKLTRYTLCTVKILKVA